MSKSGQLFTADRLRQEGEERDTEYAEYCYLHGIAPPRQRFPVDDEQPETKPAKATTLKPHANDH